MSTPTNINNRIFCNLKLAVCIMIFVSFVSFMHLIWVIRVVLHNTNLVYLKGIKSSYNKVYFDLFHLSSDLSYLYSFYLSFVNFDLKNPSCNCIGPLVGTAGVQHSLLRLSRIEFKQHHCIENTIVPFK